MGCKGHPCSCAWLSRLTLRTAGVRPSQAQGKVWGPPGCLSGVNGPERVRECPGLCRRRAAQRGLPEPRRALDGESPLFWPDPSMSPAWPSGPPRPPGQSVTPQASAPGSHVVGAGPTGSLLVPWAKLSACWRLTSGCPSGITGPVPPSSLEYGEAHAHGRAEGKSEGVDAGEPSTRPFSSPSAHRSPGLLACPVSFFAVIKLCSTSSWEAPARI